MRIVEGASLFNIDFAAGIFSGILNPEEGIWVFLNDNPPLTENTEHYEYISRLAIPTISWDYCSDKIWRLKFIPTKKVELKSIESSLNNLKNDLQSFFNNEGFEEIRKFEERFDLLLAQFHNNESSIEFYRKILKLIYQRVLFRDNIDVTLTGGFLKMNTTEHNDSAQLFLELYNQLKNKSSGEYAMVKGGKLIFEIGENIINCNQLIKNEFSFTLFNRKFRNEVVEIKFEDIIYATLPKFSLKCEGPIQMLQLQSKGIICHLPWYMEGTTTENNYKCLEHITPISNSYSSRVSTFICERNKINLKTSSKNMRLNPSGYSLLDYNHPRVLRYISFLLKINSVEKTQLDDWIFLINNYPISKEKLAEHQGQVTNFIDVQIKSHLKMVLKTGCKPNDRQLLKANIKPNFLSAGSELIVIISLLKYFRMLISDENETQLTVGQLSFLKEISDGETICLDLLIDNLASIVNSVGSKLIQFGFDRSQWNELNSNLNQAIVTFKEEHYIPLKEEPSIDLYKKNRCFGKLIMNSTNILFQYYRFVSFFCATALKANIFTSFVLFGEEDYADLIKEILKEREKKTFKYIPIYFEKISANTNTPPNTIYHASLPSSDRRI